MPNGSAVCCTALALDESALNHAGADIINSHAFMLAAVGADGRNLVFASEILRTTDTIFPLSDGRFLS